MCVLKDMMSGENHSTHITSGWDQWDEFDAEGFHKAIEKAKELIVRQRTPVFYFTYLVDDIFSGPYVNKILNCNRFEIGFIMPEKYRYRVRNGRSIVEREPNNKEWFLKEGSF